MTHDELEILARRAGTAIRQTTKEIPVTVTDITGTDTDRTPAPNRGTWSVLAAAAVVVLLVVGSLTWLLTTGNDHDPAPAKPPRTFSIAGEPAEVRVSYPRAWQVHPWGQDVLHQDQIEPAAKMPAKILDPEADGTIPGVRVTVLIVDSVMSTVAPRTDQVPVPADLAEHLAEVPALEVGAVREIAVDGRPATQVDVAVPTPKTVKDVSRAELFCLGTTGNYCHPVVSEVQTNRYVVIPVEGGAVVVVAEAATATSAEAYAAMDKVLAGLRVTP